MRAPGFEKIARIARWAANKVLPSVLILAYHRVIALPTDPQLLCVSPQHFAEHLEVLKRYTRPINLQQLVDFLKFGQLPRRCTVITFDDGYADNLLHAKPLLEKFGIPATIFVATEYIDSDHEFWWDQLERVLLHPGVLPKELSLCIDGKAHNWELGDAFRYDEMDHQRHLSWNVLMEVDPSLRQVLYRTLCEMLRPLSEEKRCEVLGSLNSLSGASSKARPTHRALSAEEVVNLGQGGLIEVGAHGMTHSVLSRLPIDRQIFEIAQSKVRLEEILGSNIKSFSYPYGSLSDFTDETADSVREAGFACACANFESLVRRKADFFRLPRFLMRDWGGDKFARQLERWFNN